MAMQDHKEQAVGEGALLSIIILDCFCLGAIP